MTNVTNVMLVLDVNRENVIQINLLNVFVLFVKNKQYFLYKTVFFNFVTSQTNAFPF